MELLYVNQQIRCIQCSNVTLTPMQRSCEEFGSLNFFGPFCSDDCWTKFCDYMRKKYND
jgi:hypothetical protein